MLNLKIIFDIIINFPYTTLIKIYWIITVKTAEFQTKNVPAINKVLRVLKALNTGATLTLGKDVVKLAEANNDGFFISLLAGMMRAKLGQYSQEILKTNNNRKCAG